MPLEAPQDMLEDLTLAGMLFLAAVLYSSVGHGGGSGYLAVFALWGLAERDMRPVTLVLNVCVSTIAVSRFARAGWFSWRTFWPFAAGSIPAAYLGGTLTLPGLWYRPLVGATLVYSAWRMLRGISTSDERNVAPPPIFIGVLCGTAIGLLAGLTGIGGGVYLSPVILFFAWADLRTTSGISGAFILVNSLAGLLGLASKTVDWPAALPWWIGLVLVGGWIGTELGTRRLPVAKLRWLLAGVLCIAGAKLLFTSTSALPKRPGAESPSRAQGSASGAAEAAVETVGPAARAASVSQSGSRA